MKILNHILHPIKKFLKGMLALLTLNLIVVTILFIFDSCKKSEYQNSIDGKANSKFLSALDLNKKAIGSVSFAKQPDNQSTIAQRVAPENELAPIYLEFPNGVNSETLTLFQNTNSIHDLSDLIHYTDATVQYEPTPENSNYQLEVPVEQVINSLNPLVQESKQYLYSKGFTEQDIQQMIAEENAEETDLIPLVMAVTQAENSQLVARNYSTFFINSAQAKTWSEVGSCAMEAIGADILFSIVQSTATTWTMATIKKAFKTVAKRMLGPIGVAVAVVEFGWCLMR